MFVIDRTRGGTEDAPEETIDVSPTLVLCLLFRNCSVVRLGKADTKIHQMAGTTGNIYTITISQIPQCTCPDNRKGNQCKHIVYVCICLALVHQKSLLIRCLGTP